MKNYKFIIPIVLVALFVFSVFSITSQKVSDESEYNEAVSTARELRKDGIYVDADEFYQQALESRPSKELYYEIGEMYLEEGNLIKAEEWGETFKEAYSTEPESYEYLMNVCKKNQDYTTLWELYKEMGKRRLSSPKADKLVSKVEYEFDLTGSFEDVGVFGNGYCPVMLKEKWGFVDEKGTKNVDVKFDKVGSFSSDEMAPVVDGEKKAYFIDNEGNKKRVIKGVKNLAELGFIVNGVFPLKSGNTWSYYNLKSEKLFGDYSNATALANGFAAVEKNNRWGLINDSGKAVSDFVYEDIITDEKTIAYRNDRLFVQKDSYYYMVDANLKEITNQKYNDAKLFNDETYAAVSINDKWGFVDKSGKIIIEPKYDDARSFSNGLAAVKQNGKWGFIDKNGKMVIKPQFNDAKDFNDKGSVFVNNGYEWELLILYKYI